MPKKIKEVESVRSQIHSGTALVFFGLGMTTLWLYQEYQRRVQSQQTLARARASAARFRPRTVVTESDTIRPLVI